MRIVNARNIWGTFMAVSVARSGQQERLGNWRDGVKKGVRRSGTLLGGATLIVGALLSAAALVNYRPSDPAFNTSAAGPVKNWLGSTGAYGSDLLLSLWGPPAALLIPLMIVLGLRLARGADAGRWMRALLLTIGGMAAIGTAAALLWGGAVNGLPAGWGGAFGLSLAKLIEGGIGMIGEPAVAEPFRLVAIALTALTGLFLLYLGLGLRAEERAWMASRRVSMPRLPQRVAEPEAAEDDLYEENDEEEEQQPATKRARAPVINAPEPP
jgi:S-DNA-T family DNA segregation ATPase FtsK/SpoIIIE